MSRFPFQYFDSEQQFVDPATGKLTPYAMRQLFGQTQNAEEVGDDVVALDARITANSDDIDTLEARELIAGTGLSGGGDLTADRTFDLDADIDLLTDVDTSTTPPTNGQALVWVSADSLWKPGTVSGGGGGGGGSGVEVSRSTNFTTPGSFGASIVNFDTEVKNDDGYYDGAVSTSDITVPDDGWYSISIYGKSAANTGSGREFFIDVNGSNVAADGRSAGSGYNDPHFMCNTTKWLSASDVITFRCSGREDSVNISGIRATVAKIG